jgi:hypothetical protein
MQKVPCNPSIGSDIEAFLFNTVSKRIVPCVGILPGTKESPHQLPGLKAGYAVQEDNVMVEFNIPPARSAKAFAASIEVAKDGVRKMLPPKHSLVFAPSHRFAAKDLKSDQAQMFGCEPDFDAYAGGVQRTPLLAEGVLDRGAGGHIHLGGDFHCPDFVAALFADLMIGVNLELRAPQGDARAKFYGQPGIFRPKPYGIEYRTPSCTWADNSDMSAWVGQVGTKLANWLTNNDAQTIQKVFRAFKDWPAVRAYMLNGENPPDRSTLIDRALKAGVPI